MPSDGITLPAGQTTGLLPKPASPMGFTPAEAAKILGKSRNTIYQWLKADVLTSRLINGVHYIRRESLYALLDAESAGVVS